MTEEYTIRKSTLSDNLFIAETIIAAEKSNSEKLSFSTLFNLSETTAKELIVSMLKEEIDGCELSTSSFLIAEKNGNYSAAVGGWIEGFGEENPSKILKSNLIGFTFPEESIRFLQSKSNIIKDILIEREKNSLQIEYVYTKPDSRGKRLARLLIGKHIENARSIFPGLNKVQVQVFENNFSAIKLYEAVGFKTVKVFESKDIQILNYLPYKTKILMEKRI